MSIKRLTDKPLNSPNHDKTSKSLNKTILRDKIVKV